MTALLTALAATLMTGVVASAAAGQPAPTEIDPTSVGIVVLVDESGSLADPDVIAERAAASVIAQSEFSPDSQVSVVGFGGRNGRPGQSAVRVVCGATKVTAGQDRDSLARCIGELHRRTKDEGDDTDFPSALNQGLSLVEGMTGVSSKLMFVLTDGKLNVDNDPSYGSEPGARTAAARAAMNRYLAQANERQVQVWPLGFGKADKGELDAFAAGGSQRTCGPSSPKPEARIATDTAAVVTQLANAYAAARCAQSATPAAGSLPPGGSTDLTVEVPAIATDGSIAVHKANPAISVGYYDPAGNPVPKAGELGESRFQVSGASNQVEVLRIRNPQPGRWLVRLTAPPGVAASSVSAMVIWQGAVRSAISMNPPAPRPGTPATIDLTLSTRRGLLADPASLRDITASAKVSGAGFPDLDVPLTAGSGGRFSGQVTIPGSATGAIHAVAVVGGPGIANDERPLDTSVDLGPAQVRAQVLFEHRRVEPGSTMDGTVVFTNSSGTGRRVLLLLADLDARSAITVTPASGDVAASGNTSMSFRLAFDAETKLGFGQARLRVVDEADRDRAYAESLLTFEVGFPPPPPSLMVRLLWLWLVALLLLVIAGWSVTVWLRRRRGDRDVRGLRVRLYRGGRLLGYLDAPQTYGTRFTFTVREYGGEHALNHATDAAESAESYAVWRKPGRAVAVLQPVGTEHDLSSADDRIGLPNGLELAVSDVDGSAPDPGRGPGWFFRQRSTAADAPDEPVAAVPAPADSDPLL